MPRFKFPILACSPWNRKILMAVSRVFALGPVFYELYNFLIRFSGDSYGIILSHFYFIFSNCIFLGCSRRSRKMNLPFPLKSSVQFLGVRIGIGSLIKHYFTFKFPSLGCSPWNRQLVIAVCFWCSRKNTKRLSYH